MSTVTVRFLGHSAFALEADGTTVLIDPFLTGNPAAAGELVKDPAKNESLYALS